MVNCPNNTQAKINLKIVFKMQNNSSTFLYDPKYKKEKFNKSGVHKLNCLECKVAFILAKPVEI